MSAARLPFSDHFPFIGRQGPEPAFGNTFAEKRLNPLHKTGSLAILAGRLPFSEDGIKIARFRARKRRSLVLRVKGARFKGLRPVSATNLPFSENRLALGTQRYEAVFGNLPARTEAKPARHMAQTRFLETRLLFSENMLESSGSGRENEEYVAIASKPCRPWAGSQCWQHTFHFRTISQPQWRKAQEQFLTTYLPNNG